MQVASTDLAAALTAAVAGGYVAEMTGQTFTVTQPIVINVNSTIQGPLGIDLGGAHIVSRITNGAPIIQINVGPGVDLRYLTLANFTIDGNGQEGDGIKIVAAGNDRWVYNFTVDNVTVKNVGGYGLDAQGSVFEGLVSNSSMIGNAQGGAYFSHFSAGQVSALRWFGGSFEHNGGAGLILANGARDISVDNVSFTANGGVGISAEQGITSVTNSHFTDNSVAGIWFQNFGNFSANTFVNSGVQATGITGWLNGGASVIDNTSIYTGAGSDPTILANLQGFGQAYMEGDVGRTVTGSNIALSGVGAGNSALVTVASQGVALPALEPITAATTAAMANSTGSGTLETALRSALTTGTVADLSAASFTVSSTIVINLAASKVMPTGIDLGGAKILSQITNGAPVIEIIVGPGVDIASLKLSNFLIAGNGREGDGIKIVADGSDRSVMLDISGVNVEHVGGIGLDAIGNVSGTVFDSWMHGNLSGGARFANSAGGGTADGLQWIGGGFRKNGVAGLILDNGAHDMTVQGAYFVENNGPGVDATRGITLIEQSGFENNNGIGVLTQGAATLVDTTFSTWGVQQTAIGGYLAGQQITLIATGNEYYGANPDNTVLANIQGTGTLALAGGGKVIASQGITMKGLVDQTAAPPPPADTTVPAIISITTSGPDITAGAGNLSAGKTVTFTATFSEGIAVAGGTPSLQLNDGGTATYVGGSGTAALTFSHTVQAGQNAADLAVVAFSLNGATIKDSAGNLAVLSGALTNPAAVLKVDTVAPAVASIATSGPGITAGNGTLGTGGAVTFAVTMNEAVLVNGTPSLSLNSGGTANYVGGSGSSTLSFSHTVTAGQTATDLSVTGLNLNGSSIKDTAGNDANTSSASNYNPAGTLKVDTSGGSQPPPPVVPPTVSAALVADTGASSSDRITWNGSIKGTGDANSIVRFTVDGQASTQTVTANSNGDWTFTPTGLTDGLHTIVASQTNAGGATGNASLSFTLDRTTPVPTITGAIIAGGQVTLTGTSSAGDQLSVYDGGTWLGFATAGSNGAWNFVAAASATQSHSYGVIATDLAGNDGKVAGVQPTIGGSTPPPPAPAPVVTTQLTKDTGASASDFITSNPSLSGTADSGATIHFTIDGTAIASVATASASGAWTFAPTGLIDGQHSIVATETNLAGISGSSSLLFTLDRAAPNPAFTAISQANGKATLSGTSGAGDTLSVYDGNTWLGFASTASDGRWSFTANAASSVTHNFGVIATDLAGNEGKGLSRAMLGSTGADTLSGSTGSDMISGGNGQDRITGGAGNDLLTGGTGADNFVFNLAPGPSNLDRITDFAHGSDKLMLAKSAFGALSVGNLATNAFVQGTVAQNASQRLVYDQSSGLLSYDPDGNGATPLVGVVLLTPGQTLTAQDIVVI